MVGGDSVVGVGLAVGLAVVEGDGLLVSGLGSADLGKIYAE